jgi:hypothetical protein
MKIGHQYAFATGRSRNECHVLGHRFDEAIGFRPEAGESWVLRFTDTTIDNLFWKPGWFTGLWEAPSRAIYVSDAYSKVFYRAPGADSAAARQGVDLEGTLTGLAGVDEENVFVWGRQGGKPVMYLGRRERWRPIPAPGFVIGLHGPRPDLVFAVGEAGMIARWDGSAWHNMPSGTDRTLSSVFVESEDEVYACGHGKQLLQGSVHGWVRVLEHSAPLRAVVKWKGDVWVAAGGDEGLSQLQNGKLVSIKPNLKATQIDARHNLLITCPDKVVDTVDGKKFVATTLSGFEEMSGRAPATWE